MRNYIVKKIRRDRPRSCTPYTEACLPRLREQAPETERSAAEETEDCIPVPRCSWLLIEAGLNMDHIKHESDTKFREWERELFSGLLVIF